MADLTGFYRANDDGFYYFRSEGDTLWWVGLSNDGNLQHGFSFSNVFQGQVSGNIIDGIWADVPRGITTGRGILSLQILPPSASGSLQLQKINDSGGFSGSFWESVAPPPADMRIYDVFDAVKKNQNAWRDHSLLDNLKPYKDHVVVFGTVIPDGSNPPIHVDYPPNAGRTYKNFICLNNNDSPPDGDMNFNIAVDRAQLNRQTNFWTDGWNNPAGDISAKLDDSGNLLHCEVIMFGRTAECGNDQHFDDEPLLPGWQEVNGNSVLLNGRPISGEVSIGQTASDGWQVNSVLSMTLGFGTSVRVTGVLALDCGHGITRPCDEDDSSVHNQEIHPVYAIDIVNPTPSDDLTGVWADDDGRTYYVRHLGTTLWWLGVGPFRDPTFGRVFLGTVQDLTITGQWADVPIGRGQSSGSLTLQVDPGKVALVTNPGSSEQHQWIKLYDALPSGLITDVAPAVAAAGDYVFFFAKSLDGRIFYNRSRLGQGGEGWVEVGGDGRTNTSPAAAAVGIYMFIVIKGLDGNVYLNQTGDLGQSFVGWLPMNFSTDVAPDVASAGDYVFFFAKSLDGRIFYNRSRLGQGGEGWVEVSGDGRTDTSPAAAAVGTYMFIAVKGLDGNVYLNQTGDLGQSFVGWLPMNFSTDVAPAVAAAGDYVFFFAKSLDGRIFYNRSRLGQGGEGWVEVSGDFRTDTSPAAAAVGTYMFIAVKGLDGNVYLNQTGDLGQSFVGWLPMT